MPLLNFKPRFAPDVESGKKRQTIRPKRKYPVKRGDKLYLYTGCRTKQARKLGEAICKFTQDIEITCYPYYDVMNLDIILDGQKLNSREKNNLIQNDGFIFENDFIYFFGTTYTLPFNGDLIKW